MSATTPSDLRFEIGHVLFMDIVGYSKLVIDKQAELTRKLKEIARSSEQFRLAEAEGTIVKLPTGDGIALVFRNNPEAPAQCALEISTALRAYPESAGPICHSHASTTGRATRKTMQRR